MKKTITKSHRKIQLFFLSVLVSIFLFLAVEACFAVDFMEDFDSNLDSWSKNINDTLNYSLSDNPGNLRIYFNGKEGGRSFRYAFSGKQWVFETKVHYNMNPLYSYLGAPVPGQDFGSGSAITYVTAGGKGFDLAARILNGYTDTIIANALGWSTMKWNVALQQWEYVYGLYSGGDGTHYFRFVRDDNNVSMFYSPDGTQWQQCYSEIVVVPGILSDQNDIRLSADFRALTDSPGIAYVEYDYVKISTADIKAKDPKDPNKLLDIDKNFKPLLGQRWTFVATTPDGQTKIDAKWTVTSDTSTMTSPNSALFPKTVGIFFDSSTVTSEKEFQIVHLGTATISISDPVTKQLLAMKRINVKVPITAKLGPPVLPDKSNNNYQYDSAIFKIADESGVPPQYIKGHIFKESDPKFNIKSYRYEPGTDYTCMQTGIKLKNDTPFNKYILDNGTGVTPTNRALRNKFKIDPTWSFPPKDWTSPRNPSPNAQTIEDLENSSGTLTNVLCSNIYFNNDGKQNWTKKGTNKKKTGSIDKLRAYWQAKGGTDFTAQTIIAASYGFFQTMYHRAVQAGKYDDDPELLFDPQKYLKVVKAMYLSTDYLRGVKKLKDNDYNYADVSAWKTTWSIAFRRWNWNEANYGEEVTDYGRFYFQPQE